MDYLELSTDSRVEKMSLQALRSLRRGSEENQPLLPGPTELSVPNFIITCTNVGGSVVNAVNSHK